MIFSRASAGFWPTSHLLQRMGSERRSVEARSMDRQPWLKPFGEAGSKPARGGLCSPLPPAEAGGKQRTKSRLKAGFGLERLSRLIKVSKDGTVLYKAEKPDCRAFPLLAGDGMRPGAKRNYEVRSPLDFLAEFTQHIPAKGAHMVRYYGWYSNKSRGMRLKAEKALAPQPAVAAEEGSAPARPCNFTWAKLIKRVYEVDPLRCPKCETTMKVVSFIEPPQEAVIEKILKHCGLWEEPARGPPAESATADLDAVAQALAETELTYVPIDQFFAEW
jgi:hypothetical protein